MNRRTELQKPKATALKLRLPQELHGKITKAAEKAHRSLNGEIIVAIEKHLEPQK